MGLSGSFALPVLRTVTMQGSCRAVTLPCFIRVSSVATRKAAGNSFLGSTGHWPVPPGDSPGGTGSAPGADKDWPFGRDGLDLPVGESPTGTGGSPVLPILPKN
jgi:hypothetical protein